MRDTMTKLVKAMHMPNAHHASPTRRVCGPERAFSTVMSYWGRGRGRQQARIKTEGCPDGSKSQSFTIRRLVQWRTTGGPSFLLPSAWVTCLFNYLGPSTGMPAVSPVIDSSEWDHRRSALAGLSIETGRRRNQVAPGGRKVTDRMLVIPRKKRRMRSPTEKVKTPYGLEVVENHIPYPLPKDRLFRNLPQAVRAELAAISLSAAYRKGEILFAEGQAPRGIFVIYEGSVKLSANSFDGKSLILHLATPGDVVGLPGTISGKRYETTAEALEPVQASFISRKPFRDFVRAHGEVGLRVAETLSDIYHATYREFRYLGLSGSAEGKLARFLLDLTADQDHDHGHARAKLILTHEEIADVVGTSRETVTRLFAEFKRKRLVEVHGSRLLIVNKASLQKLLA